MRWILFLLLAACEAPQQTNAAEAELFTHVPELFAAATPGGTGLGFPLAQDATHVFWFDETGGYLVPAGPILTRSKAGLDPAQVLVQDTWISNVTPKKFASDGGSLFWFDLTINRLPKNGGTPVALTSSAAASGVNALVVDNRYVYFTNGQGVVRVAKSGGSPETIASGATAFGLAIDERWIYFADDTAAAILRVAKDGSTTPEVLVSDVAGVVDIEVDATSLYWSVPSEGIVATAWKSWPGAAPIVLVDEEIRAPDWMIGDIAVDLFRVYWQRPGTNRIAAISKWGGAIRDVAQAASPGFVLVDGSYVYWSEDAAIRRIRK